MHKMKIDVASPKVASLLLGRIAEIFATNSEADLDFNLDLDLGAAEAAIGIVGLPQLDRVAALILLPVRAEVVQEPVERRELLGLLGARAGAAAARRADARARLPAEAAPKALGR